MNAVIIQARMGSTRLPGKVLRPLAGRSMLAQQVIRLRACREVGTIVIATTTATEDDAIVEEARRLDVAWFRGSSSDVLARYAGAARAVAADVVIRVTSDCPLIQPEIVDRVIAALLQHPTLYDYSSNTHRRTYPMGLDTEAMHRDTLERMARMATSAPAREHVTVFIRERPELFAVTQTCADEDHAALRWTVDTPDDLALVEGLYRELGLADRIAPYAEMIAFARAHPALCTANAHIAQRHWGVAHG